jgi:hypothetical protein
VIFLVAFRVRWPYALLVDAKESHVINTSVFISKQDLTSQIADLPSSRDASPADFLGAVMINALPLPLPCTTDTGRIKFGAACRIPVQK